MQHGYRYALLFWFRTFQYIYHWLKAILNLNVNPLELGALLPAHWPESGHLAYLNVDSHVGYVGITHRTLLCIVKNLWLPFTMFFFFSASATFLLLPFSKVYVCHLLCCIKKVIGCFPCTNHIISCSLQLCVIAIIFCICVIFKILSSFL